MFKITGFPKVYTPSVRSGSNVTDDSSVPFRKHPKVESIKWFDDENLMMFKSLLHPNSCFSSLQVKTSTYIARNRTTVNANYFKDPDTDNQDYKLHGEWLALDYQVKDSNYKLHNITVETFVYNSFDEDEQFIEYDGMIGMSPCPDRLKKYSFSWYMINQNDTDPNRNVRVKKLEWWVQSIERGVFAKSEVGLVTIFGDALPEAELYINRTQRLSHNFSLSDIYTKQNNIAADA